MPVAGFAQNPGSHYEVASSVESFGAGARTIPVMGHVVLEGGVTPTEPVLVQPVCNGAPQSEAYTDEKGRFNVDLGRESRANGGAGRPAGGPNSGFGRQYEALGNHESDVDIRGCELRVELMGYRTEAVRIDGRQGRSVIDVGAVTLRRSSEGAGASVSATTLGAPEKARRLYEEAGKEFRRPGGQPDKAAKQLQAAITEYPRFAAAWRLLGEIHLKSGDTAKAEKAFAKAVEADPAYIQPYLPLARIAFGEQRWDDTARLASQVLRLNPYITEAVYLQALANFHLGQTDLAEKSALEVQASQDAGLFPETHYLLGLIRSKRGDFPAAAESFRAYLEARPQSQAAVELNRKLEEWAALGVITK
jgi:TolA-binding protein